MSAYSRMRKPAVYDKRTGQTVDDTYIPHANFIKFDSVQKDIAYATDQISPDDRKVYEDEVKIQKEEARKALVVFQGINASDLDVMTWPTLDDPLGYPVITYQQLWDATNETSIKARWFWDTRRYKLAQAQQYYQYYQEYLYLNDKT